jgi:hypothetical protein
MSDYITNFLVTLVAVLALLISAIGLSSVYSTNAKADNVKIEKQMEELETLFNELYGFHQSSGFTKWGYSPAGRGNWADKVQNISKDKNLKTYIKSLVPEKLETEFLFLKPLEPFHLWFLGRYYMNNNGQENKDTLAVKAQFEKLFKTHKSRKK